MKYSTSEPVCPVSDQVLRQVMRKVKQEYSLSEIFWKGQLGWEILKKMLINIGETNGLICVQSSQNLERLKKLKKLPAGYTYINKIKSHPNPKYAFHFVSKSLKLTYNFTPDDFNIQKFNCPSCGKKVGKKTTSLAHSVIPQQVWKKIINKSVPEFVENVRKETLIKLPRHKFVAIRAYDTFKNKYNTKESKLTGDLIDKEKISNMCELLGQGALIMTQYAANDHANRQCHDCEKAQANATLIQRIALANTKKIEKIKTHHKVSGKEFIGSQFVDGEDSAKLAERAKNITLAQISKFLLGIERWMNTTSKNDKNLLKIKKCEPVFYLILDHWEEFVWTFRSVALQMCCISYSGDLGIKDF